MPKKIICREDKYEFVNNVIGLPISLQNLPEEIQVHRHTFYLPNPYHVSLVYVGKIIKKYRVKIPDFENKVVDDFCSFTKAHAVELVGYKNEFRFVNRDGVKTVIVMCEISNLNKFFDLINRKYNLRVKYPATHVTLYNTRKGEPGIYLMDLDDLKNFTVHIENPIGFPL